MDLKITGKTALVTASSRGLGKEIALTLAREGAQVIICSKEETHLQEAVTEIKEKTGQNVQHYIVDLNNEKSLQDFLMKVIDIEKNEIDILVYNVGGPPPGEFDQVSDDEWDKVYNSIIRNYRIIIKKILPHMIENSWGRIVTIASTSVRQPIENLLLSNVFRPAVAGLNKTLSNKYAHQGITFNTICPGGIYTLRIEEVLKKRVEITKMTIEEIQKQYIKQIPMQRFGKPQEVADAVAFIVSDLASFITGTSLSIDGGITKSIF